MANDSVVTQNTLETFYNNKVYPYLNGATHTGCVPLGTVLPYYGETAPDHFLICDGTEYLKSDYGELATHLLSLTDPTPYQGSDSDHFKVPDLRGEFLRGSGTNSHTDQGSGGAVGEHQDATEAFNLRYIKSSGKIYMYYNKNTDISAKNPDMEFNNGTDNSTFSISSGSYAGSPNTYSSRPTNTSVTYIIAYQNAYIDLALDGFPIDITQPQDGQLLMYDATAGRWVNGGHKYSTDEHIVGTWIDGKPIYEKTITGLSVSLSTGWHTVVAVNNIDILIDFQLYRDSSVKLISLSGAGYEVGLTANSEIQIMPIASGQATRTLSVMTIQYTKTTDT